MRSKLSLRVGFAFALCCFASVSAACSPSKKAASDAGPMTGAKKPCIAPGIGGECTCGSGKTGTTTCGADKRWGECKCIELPPGAMCREGETLTCGVLCPGESAARKTKCVNGTYDCRCAAAAGANAAGAGGAAAGAGGAAAGAGGANAGSSGKP